MGIMVDFMANPFEGYEDEETRRKRIEEQRKRLGQTEVGSTTEKTYMDGSKTITQKTEVPAQQDLIYRPQQESGQFMRPLATPQNQGQFLPIAPSQNLIDYTRRMESGNNPNIGYHYPANQQGVRKSTAYGPLGITAPQYAEIQRNFPEFRGIPIEQANQDQLAKRNFETFAKQLQALGVEPSESNVSGAHLIGAAGMKRYLETGQLNPEQAAQFGGMRGFENAVKNRMALQPSPASGAAMRQPPAPVAPTEAQLGELGINTAQPLIQRPPEVGAGAEGTAGEDVAQQRLQTYNQNFLRDQDNIEALLRMREDAAAPSTVRNLASERAYELLNAQVTKERADRKGQELITNNDTKKIGNILASDPKDEEGSYLKLFLLGFVSPEAARMEASKLGLVPTKYSQATIQNEDGTQSVVQLKTRADGKVVGGIDMEGRELSKDMLNKAMAGVGQKLGVVGGTYVNDTTGEVGRVVTDEKTGLSYVQTDKGRKPMTGFRPQSSTGTLADQRTRLVQEMNIKLQGKTREEQMAIQRNYNQQLVAAGYPPLQPSDTPLVAPQISGGSQAAQAPAAQQGAVAPTQAAQAPAAQQGAVAPTQAAQAQRPSGPELAARAEAQKKEATEIAEDVAKAKINVGKNSDTADYLLTKIDQLIKHPGFSVSVGATVQPGFQYIPGTDRADWKARFEEIKGQQFLQAFESLKGGGAITDKEGAKAQSAISRMSTSQSEKEFKEAANDFIGVIQRGVDRQRKKAGLEPLYEAKKESERKEAEKGRASTGVKWRIVNP